MRGYKTGKPFLPFFDKQSLEARDCFFFDARASVQVLRVIPKLYDRCEKN